MFLNGFCFSLALILIIKVYITMRPPEKANTIIIDNHGLNEFLFVSKQARMDIIVIKIRSFMGWFKLFELDNIKIEMKIMIIIERVRIL